MVNNRFQTFEHGTHYPNRIFVGSLPGSVNAGDLAEFFKEFGTVLEGKVVLDTNGNSRRFGFVTFATNKDVKRVLSHGVIFFKGKQLNVGPAVKRVPECHSSIVCTPPVSVANPVTCYPHPLNVAASFHSSPTPPLYVIAYNGMPGPTNCTNFRISCGTVPLSPTSSVIPGNGQMCFNTLNHPIPLH